MAVEGWQYIEVAGQLSPSPVHFVGVGAHCKSGKLRGLEENARDGIILSSPLHLGWDIGHQQGPDCLLDTAIGHHGEPHCHHGAL